MAIFIIPLNKQCNQVAGWDYFTYTTGSAGFTHGKLFLQNSLLVQ